jgi:hypothetical protein
VADGAQHGAAAHDAIRTRTPTVPPVPDDTSTDREPLGDLPLGKYTVENTITVFDPGRHIAWAPGAPGDRPLGHVYGYQLVAVDGATTDVTSYCDWTDVDGAVRDFLPFPVISLAALEASLDALAQRAETGP